MPFAQSLSVLRIDAPHVMPTWKQLDKEILITINCPLMIQAGIIQITVALIRQIGNIKPLWVEQMIETVIVLKVHSIPLMEWKWERSVRVAPLLLIVYLRALPQNHLPLF